MRESTKMRDIRCEGCGKLLHVEIFDNAQTKGEKVKCIYCHHVNEFKD